MRAEVGGDAVKAAEQFLAGNWAAASPLPRHLSSLTLCRSFPLSGFQTVQIMDSPNPRPCEGVGNVNLEKLAVPRDMSPRAGGDFGMTEP